MICDNRYTMIIDFHTHLFPSHIIEQREEYLQRDRWFGLLYRNPSAKMATAEDLIESMDQAGVDACVAFGFAWRDSSLCQQHNDYVLQSMARYPGRIIGFAMVNPSQGDAALLEVERCANEGMRGVGELMPDGQGYTLQDESVMRPLMEWLADRNMPLLIHSSEPVGHAYHGKGTMTPEKVYRFIQHYRETTIILAHWGGGLLFYELMSKVREACARVYYDTAASLFLYDDRIFSLAATLAEDRVLWGTDYPLLGHDRFLRRLKSAGLTPASVKKILGGNAARLLGLSQGVCP